MSTLHRIREFALVTVMATGALMASATQADEVGASERSDIVGTYADLGHMTVMARRSAEVAELGSMIVRVSAFPTRARGPWRDHRDRTTLRGPASRQPG